MITYYVYMMTNRSRTLYTGMTNDLTWRVRQHKTKEIAGFTARYNVTQLAFYESFANVWEAIAAEKKIKGWTRIKKIQLIESQNPNWMDLAGNWYESPVVARPANVTPPVRRWEEAVPTRQCPLENDERSFGVPQDDMSANVGAARVVGSRPAGVNRPARDNAR